MFQEARNFKTGAHREKQPGEGFVVASISVDRIDQGTKTEVLKVFGVPGIK
jgi:hypothetical protein